MSKDKKKKDKHKDDISGFLQQDSDLIKPVQAAKSSSIAYLLLAFVFGIFGGIFGELYVNNYFAAWGLPLTNIYQQYSGVTDEVKEPEVIVFKSVDKDKTDTDFDKLIETAAASVVGIFPVKEEEGGVWDSVYLPDDQLGNGLILTADGWIVTTKSVVGDSDKKYKVVLADKKIFTVSEIVFDPVSEAVFLKIDADGLKVVKFAERSQWRVGNSLFVLGNAFADGGVSVIETNLNKLVYQEIGKPTDFIQSSEKFNKLALLADSVDKILFGSPVLNRQGEIMGLVFSNVDGGSTVLPSRYLETAIDNIITLGEIVRPYLGVAYLDLAHTLGLPGEISEGQTKGAVLYGEKNSLPAVAPGSPAAKAGLKAGDIVVAVNDEPVDFYNSLTDLIQQYKVGDVVKLTVIFEGEKREVEVALDSLPQTELE